MDQRTPLGRIMEDEGRKQSWLAERAEIDQADISRIVRRGMHPGDDKAKRIADALGRRVEDVFPTDAARPAA